MEETNLLIKEAQRQDALDAALGTKIMELIVEFMAGEPQPMTFEDINFTLGRIEDILQHVRQKLAGRPMKFIATDQPG